MSPNQTQPEWEADEYLERMNEGCPDCFATGKVICDNPDHGFLNAMSFHDIGRIGCPVCGHDEKYRTKDDCEECHGTGELQFATIKAFITRAIERERSKWVAEAKKEIESCCLENEIPDQDLLSLPSLSTPMEKEKK